MWYLMLCSIPQSLTGELFFMYSLQMHRKVRDKKKSENQWATEARNLSVIESSKIYASRDHRAGLWTLAITLIAKNKIHVCQRNSVPTHRSCRQYLEKIMKQGCHLQQLPYPRFPTSCSSCTFCHPSPSLSLSLCFIILFSGYLVK